jgi:hypothetical protein
MFPSPSTNLIFLPKGQRKHPQLPPHAWKRSPLVRSRAAKTMSGSGMGERSGHRRSQGRLGERGGSSVPSQVVRSVLTVSTKAITPRLADRLCSLAESQLQMQTARSAALDGGALGVVSACAAIAALILSVRSAHHLWIAALTLLALSAGLAIRALLLAGAKQNGPLVVDMLDARVRDGDAYLEDVLLKDLATEALANERALARKDPIITRAVALLVLLSCSSWREYG